MDRFDGFGLWNKNRRKRRFLLDENYSFKTNPKFELPSIRGTINEPENLDLLRERRKPLRGENYRAFEENPLVAPSFKTRPELEPSPIREQPISGMYDYWKQPVIRGKGGKGGLPLDLGVTLAGMLAHSIAPNEWGGRMGAGLANLAGPIYGKRMEYELEEPERGLRKRLLRAKITKAEEPKIPSEWEAYRTGTEAEKAVVERYKELGKTQKTDEGFNKIGGKWYSGIWEGNKFIPRRETSVSETAKLDKEVAEGKSFYERAPEKWEEMEEKKAQIKAKYHPSAEEKREKKDKAIDKTVRGIDTFIEKNYNQPIKILEKKLENALDDKEEAQIQKQINDHKAQKRKAINTQNKLRNREIRPDQIKWGGKISKGKKEIKGGDKRQYLAWWGSLTSEKRKRYLEEQKRRRRQGISRGVTRGY